MVDNNGDGKKSVTRQAAYTQVFRDWLWKDYPRLSLRTGCANQDIHTALAAWRVNECLKTLSQKDAFPDWFFNSAFRMVMGVMPREAALEAFTLNITSEVDRGGHGDQMLISPGGVTMEWGFAPGYGQMQDAFAEMCEITNDPVLKAQYEKFIGAIQHFFIPWNTGSYCTWMVESAVGSRNTDAGFRPGLWGDFVYAANEMENPVAQRIVRFGLEQTDNFAEVSHGRKDRMHLTSEANRTLAILNHLEAFEVFDATASLEPGKTCPVTIETVNVEAGIIALCGVQAPAGGVMRIDVAGQIPSFTTYESWTFECDGGEAPAQRAAFVEVSQQDRLRWHVRNAAEERALQHSTAHRLHNEMRFEHAFRGPVRKISFDYEG